MARVTFQGPVRSLNGFFSVGPSNTTTLVASTSLNVADYAGRLVRTNAATMTLTLPAINATADPAGAGPGSDPNNSNNIGAIFQFFVAATATSVVIQSASASDLILGSLLFVNTGTNAAGGFTANGSSNNIITLNGTTTGGIIGTTFSIEAVAANRWLIIGSTVLASGTIATPFSG